MKENDLQEEIKMANQKTITYSVCLLNIGKKCDIMQNKMIHEQLNILISAKTTPA